MALYGKSLDAASSPGSGAEFFFDVPKTHIGAIATYTGSPDAASVKIEVTLDGSTWLTSFTANTVLGCIAANSSSILCPVIGVRATLVSFDGGTSPTVTVWISAA